MAQIAGFHIGSYSQALGEVDGNGEGIYACTIDLSSGVLSEPVCVARCVNPSYLAWGPGNKHLYATREVAATDTPAVVSFEKADKKADQGQLQELNTVALAGEYPCHVAVDSTGCYLTSAQYGSGDVALFRLCEDGQINEPAQLIKHSGRGPNTDRQEGPHAHFSAVQANQNVLLAVDLGKDRVNGYVIDPATHRVAGTPDFSVQVKGGAGPRHLAMLPGSNIAYVYCELTADIYQIELDESGWRTIDCVRAFTQTGIVENAAAAIRVSPDQRNLYVSGRKLSKIACFAIDPDSKQLGELACIDTQGSGPRDFSLTPDGSYVVVANQQSNTIVSLQRDVQSGLLEPSGHSVSVGSPVCIVF